MGRRRWIWVADAVLLPAVLLLAVIADSTGTRVLAVIILISRLIHISTVVTLWRWGRRRAAHDPTTTE